MSGQYEERTGYRLKEIVRQMVGDSHIKAQPMESGFVLDVPVEEGPFGRCRIDGRDMRWQRVFITFQEQKNPEDDVFRIVTLCAPGDERFYRAALLMNMDLTMGGFCLSNKTHENKGKDGQAYRLPQASTAPGDIDRESRFAMIETMLVRDATPRKVMESVKTLANVGDCFEKMMVGIDIS